MRSHRILVSVAIGLAGGLLVRGWMKAQAKKTADEITSGGLEAMPIPEQPDREAAFASVLPGPAKQYAADLLFASKETGVNPILLAAVMGVESAYGALGPTVVSPTNDYGLMQVNKSNWDKNASIRGLRWDDPRDNILAGARLMRDSFSDIKNRLPDAPDLHFSCGISAYNAGGRGAFLGLRDHGDCDYRTKNRSYSRKVLANFNTLNEAYQAAMG